MEETSKNDADIQPTRSRFVTLTVEESESGRGRIVLGDFCMTASGFKPGDVVDVIVQADLISILRPD